MKVEALLKAGMESGDIVQSGSRQAVFCEIKNGRAKLIVKGSSGPEFDFVDPDALEPVDGDVQEDVERYAEFWQYVKGMTADKLIKAGMLESIDLLKAAQSKAGKVLKPMTIIRDGKAVRTSRWVSVDKDKPKAGKINKDEEGNTVVAIGKRSKTYAALIPDKETFNAIQSGDQAALANYLQDRFWTAPVMQEQEVKTPFGKKKAVRPETGSVTVVNQLAAAFRKSKIEGYELEDLVQETALSLLENQENGKIKNVAYDKFPSYVASVMANLNRNLRRKSQVDKQTGTAIEDMAEFLSGGGDVADEYEAAEGRQIVKSTTDRIKSRLMDWIETTGVRNKADVPKVKSVVNQYFRGRNMNQIAESTGVDAGKVRNWLSRYVTANKQLDKIAREAGYSGRNAVPDFIQDWRQVNNFQKAVKIQRRGNLILVKGAVSDGDGEVEHEIFEKFDIHGLGIAIENPTGSVRTGFDEDGNPWETQMDYSYGYIMNTEGGDGEEIDVFVGSHLNAPHVYVITINEPGEGIEDKVFLGFENAAASMDCFEKHYSNPYALIDKVSEYTVQDFLQAVGSGKKSLAKAKAEIGETRQRKGGTFKKVAEGKWEPVGEGKGAGKKDDAKNAENKAGDKMKEPDVEGPKESFKHRMASALKDFVKNIAQALETTFAGQEATGEVGQTTGDLGTAAKKETAVRDEMRSKREAAERSKKKQQESSK